MVQMLPYHHEDMLSGRPVPVPMTAYPRPEHVHGSS